MGFTCGIVGLPNAGKSSLFNALTASGQAATAAYAFCTIEPNVGRVPVPDERLETLARISKSAKITPTYLDFVDIAGLVKGASQGEGLGNQFLGHIREVDAIAHVVRCFEEEGVPHVAGAIDPIADIETIDTELMLADMESVERRIDGLNKRVRGGDKEAKATLALIERLLPALREGKPARAVPIAEDEAARLRQLQLLTAKPVMYVCNVDEESAATGNAHSARVMEHAKQEGAIALVVSAKIEAEIAQLKTAEEKQEFLAALGLAEPGLNRIVRAGHELLGLITYLTTGPTESRAWTIPKNTRAQEAAGKIHSDMERGFIAAETVSFDEFVRLGGEQAVRNAGRMRQEGRDYIMQDGDVVLFRFNV